MTVLEQLRFAAGQAGRACGLLESAAPEALDRCSATLEAAATALSEIQPGVAGLAGQPEALDEVRRLRRTVRRAAALLAHAEEYHHRWRLLLGIRTAGYGPGGVPGEFPPPGRLQVRG